MCQEPSIDASFISQAKRKVSLAPDYCHQALKNRTAFAIFPWILEFESLSINGVFFRLVCGCSAAGPFNVATLSTFFYISIACLVIFSEDVTGLKWQWIQYHAHNGSGDGSWETNDWISSWFVLFFLSVIRSGSVEESRTGPRNLISIARTVPLFTLAVVELIYGVPLVCSHVYTLMKTRELCYDNTGGTWKNDKSVNEICKMKRTLICSCWSHFGPQWKQLC